MFLATSDASVIKEGARVFLQSHLLYLFLLDKKQKAPVPSKGTNQKTLANSMKDGFVFDVAHPFFAASHNPEHANQPFSLKFGNQKSNLETNNCGK